MKVKNLMSQDEIIHFIGICGSGMAPLAQIAAGFGKTVQGSDLNPWVSSPSPTGLTIYSKHDPANLRNVSCVVVSSAIPQTNPELLEAARLGIPVIHRSELLARLMEKKRAITIAGTHGKTTTAALISHTLYSLGLDPTSAVGGLMHNFNSSALVSRQSPWFVAEADESDGSLIRYNPYLAIISNIDEDHLDHFGNIAAIESIFLSHAKKISKDGILIAGWDHPRVRNLAHQLDIPRLGYGFTIGSDVRAYDFCHKRGRSHFKVVVERDQFSVTSPLLGRHNANNVLACLSVCRALKLPIADAIDALEQFQGVMRRSDRLLETSDIILIDDYAHNPQKIHESISAVRDAWPDAKIIVIFQPHRYSRTLSLYNALSSAFSSAHYVIVTEIYPAGEPTQDIDLNRFSENIASSSHVDSRHEVDRAVIIKTVKNLVQGKSAIMTIGAGNVRDIGEQLRQTLGT